MKNSEAVSVVLEPGQFSNVIEQFILYKQGLGFKCGSGIQLVLKQLNQQLNQFKVETPHLSKDMVMRLSARHKAEVITTQSKRISILRQLAKFMNLIDLDAYVYPDYYKFIYYDSFSRISSLTQKSLKCFKSLTIYHIVHNHPTDILFGLLSFV